MKAERRVTICNREGLHARPCHAVVSLARDFDSTLSVASAGDFVDGKSIMMLMTLCAPVETELRLRAEGPDAEALLDAVVALIESGFSTPDR